MFFFFFFFHYHYNYYYYIFQRKDLAFHDSHKNAKSYFLLKIQKQSKGHLWLLWLALRGFCYFWNQNRLCEYSHWACLGEVSGKKGLRKQEKTQINCCRMWHLIRRWDIFVLYVYNGNFKNLRICFKGFQWNFTGMFIGWLSSKFFTFRVDSFSEGRQYNLYSCLPWKYILSP